nr:MAG: aldehyde-activating protein [Hyphomicrobiales bacterium]
MKGTEVENSVVFSGGCLCGTVRYEVAMAPAMMGDCYCLDCRRSSGAAHCAHMGVPKAAVKLSGEVARFEKPADSGNIVTRCFCPNCGSPIYSTNSAMPELLFIRASSLDDPEIYSPQLTVYASRAPSWGRIDPNVPSFAAMPPNAPGG